jgi:DtxR family Mn-dependent transcriptional regulator
MSRSPGISRAMEDYLKAIFELLAASDRVTTTRLAERMGCTPASVTNMVQKLSGLHLVEYTPYRGVTLTGTGERIALEVLRHHRLIELYLAEVLGYDWDRVHAEAEELEHVISEEFESRIDAALGHPERDPHGAPIPTRDGRIASRSRSTLWEAGAGNHEVEWIEDKCAQSLRRLAVLGIYPAVRVELVRGGSNDRTLVVRIEGRELGLSEKLARQIYVREVQE